MFRGSSENYFEYRIYVSTLREIIVNNTDARLSAVMLILASQRIESVIGNWMGHDVVEHEPAPTKRGAAPTIVEW